MSGVFLLFVTLFAITSQYWLAFIPLLMLLCYLGWQHTNFIFFLLIFSLPWSVEYNINSSLGTNLPDEPLMWIASALFIAHLFFNPIATLSRWKHPLVFLLLLSLGWIVVTVFFSTDWILSTKFFLAKGWYMIAFTFVPLLVFKNRRAIQFTVMLFLVSMLLVTLLCLYRHSTSGFRFATINDAVYPFFRNHVNYSAMLVCTVPLLIAAYQLTRKYRSLIVVTLVVVLVALFFSYARGAWLALIVGLLAYRAVIKRWLLFGFFTAVLLVLVGLLWIKSNDRYLEYAHDYKTTIFHQDFEQHLVATYKLKDVSTAERFNRWIAGVRMVKDNWVTGYGPNTFYYNYRPYAIPAFKTWVSENREHSTVHNYFLLTLIEQGVPGLLFFLLLVGAMLFYAETLYQRAADKFYKVAAMTCGVILVMIIVVNFLSDLIETDKVGSLFFLCLSTLIAIDFQLKNGESHTLNSSADVERVT